MSAVSFHLSTKIEFDSIVAQDTFIFGAELVQWKVSYLFDSFGKSTSLLDHATKSHACLKCEYHKEQ